MTHFFYEEIKDGKYTLLEDFDCTYEVDDTTYRVTIPKGIEGLENNG